MTRSLEQRLCDALGGSALAGRLPDAAGAFLDRRGADACLEQLDGPVLRGLARVLATRPELAGFLSHRPALLERICTADAGTLRARARALESERTPKPGDDLELALDALRVLRREETCLAACLDLGGLVAFPGVSEFLSILAEVITQRALRLARGDRSTEIAVLGMGKIAGREFTYHSDLDLIFLYEGGTAGMDAASRIGQRLIAYLSTMTGAGVAYAVDARLRPSGQQGMLVTGLDHFERYQCEQAQTWEHVALMRARPIAGDVALAQGALDRVRRHLMARTERPWAVLAEMRGRVEAERAPSDRSEIAFKTGPGGLMDVDFLAAGALLERGTAAFPALPSAASLLRAAVAGPRIDTLLEDYERLRLLEARVRWLTGRAVESTGASDEALAPVAELFEAGLGPELLRDRVAAVRSRVRAAWSEVVAADTICALE